jgi:GWxTD domain-containing protein
VRYRRLSAALTGLLLVSGVAPAEGQTPSGRVALAALSDTLASITDTARLRRSQRALREATRRPPEDDLELLRLGLVNLRLAELGAGPAARDAIAALRTATRRQPRWPMAWHWLGLAEERRATSAQSDPLELGSRVGVATMERAAGRHRKALEVDPSFTPAAEALASLTLGLRDTALLAPAVEALRRAAAQAPAEPKVLLAWGRVESAAAHSDSAREAFARYLTAGGARALGLLELARTGLAAGRAGAEREYYEGAALDDSAAVAGYRADLAAVAADADLAEFDRASGPARAAFLRRFWTDRDRIEMRAPGERLREHYRRLLYARRNFALTVSRRYYGPADAYRSGGMEIDDRGVIYVRHGAPAERLRPFVFGLMPNESWLFHRAEGDLLFHFSAGYDTGAGGDLYDYRLVESVLDLRGAGDAPRDQLLLSRQKLSNVYGRMLNWGPYGAARSRARERGVGRASIAIGTTTDSHELEFAEPLGVLADLVAVGAVGGGTIGHLVFAIAEAGSRPEPGPDGVRYRVRVRAVASDMADRAVADVDTTIVFRAPAALPRGQYLVGRVEMLMPPGRWSWRAAVQLGDSLGAVLPRDTVLVSARPGGLTLSDLALGTRSTSAVWKPTPEDTVRLTPFELFPEGSEVELYYEAAGVTRGATYRHEIAVFRLKGESGAAEERPVVTLGFDEPAADTLLRSHRVLQLTRLRPGRYLVEMRLRGPGGESVTRRRELRVVRRESP